MKSDSLGQLSRVPFNVVYGIDDPSEKLDIFNSLFKACWDKHAPLRRTKITRPPASWLIKENIRKLQTERNVLANRYLAHKSNLASVWNHFVSCATRSRLRSNQLNVLFLGGPYHPINPKNCGIPNIVFYIPVPSQSRRTLTRWTSTLAPYHNAYWDQKQIHQTPF